jgi:hypothetical protein
MLPPGCGRADGGWWIGCGVNGADPLQREVLKKRGDGLAYLQRSCVSLTRPANCHRQTAKPQQKPPIQHDKRGDSSRNKSSNCHAIHGKDGIYGAKSEPTESVIKLFSFSPD